MEGGSVLWWPTQEKKRKAHTRVNVYICKLLQKSLVFWGLVASRSLAGPNPWLNRALGPFPRKKAKEPRTAPSRRNQHARGRITFEVPDLAPTPNAFFDRDNKFCTSPPIFLRVPAGWPALIGEKWTHPLPFCHPTLTPLRPFKTLVDWEKIPNRR